VLQCVTSVLRVLHGELQCVTSIENACSVLQCVESVESELHAEGRGIEYQWSDHYNRHTTFCVLGVYVCMRERNSKKTREGEETEGREKGGGETHAVTELEARVCVCVCVCVCACVCVCVCLRYHYERHDV